MLFWERVGRRGGEIHGTTRCAEESEEAKVSELDKILNKIESRPGAEARISANVARMNKVLELEKLRRRKRLTQTVLGR